MPFILVLHIYRVMFKHYLRSIHFQQYQFELQYLMAVKPIVGNIAFHFIYALTACWNQHIQAIILEMMLFTFAIFVWL